MPGTADAPILSGDIIRTDCNSSSLLIRVSALVGGVDEERNNPFLDLMAFHDGPASIQQFVKDNLPEYTRESPRWSIPSRPKITNTLTLKFLDETGEVRHSNHQWSFRTALDILDFNGPPLSKPAAPSSAPFIFGAPSEVTEPVLKKQKHAKRSVKSAANRQRGGQAQKSKDGSMNPIRDVVLFHCTVNNSDAAVSSTFSLLHDATVGGPGFSGHKLPPLANDELIRKYFEKPDAEALYPWIREFLAVPYIPGRGTFILDNGGRVFGYRSWAALWMEGGVGEIEEAQEVLCGKDLSCEKIRVETDLRDRIFLLSLDTIANPSRPELTKWHRDNREAVHKFLKLQIIKDIVGWVTSIIRVVFPGCSILTYLTRLGVKLFNHKFRTWLVLWEMGLYLELAPGTLTTYPSSIFFHYNIDIHRESSTLGAHHQIRCL
ncbi:hypothetical protein R3P38DRAFT_2774911 [Favolaschia claudopus]|uniref:Uncharacterized protein n=1 Tax=Favolaschia claudopus TaxID=2862362 RepID=A0AAW0BWC7_9AGAR